MKKLYKYGKEIASVKSAAGVSGILIRGIEGDFYFRIYHEDHSFTDYDILHDDLAITISEHELASFYELPGRKIIDHDPQTLGLESAE